MLNSKSCLFTLEMNLNTLHSHFVSGTYTQAYGLSTKLQTSSHSLTLTVNGK